MEVVAGIGDLITFGCALAVLLSPVSSVDYSLIVGNLMIASQVRLCMARAPCPSGTVCSGFRV